MKGLTLQTAMEAEDGVTFGVFGPEANPTETSQQDAGSTPGFPQPGLGAEVLLGVGPVAQDVVDLRHHVGRHLWEHLGETGR